MSDVLEDLYTQLEELKSMWEEEDREIFDIIKE